MAFGSGGGGGGGEPSIPCVRVCTRARQVRSSAMYGSADQQAVARNLHVGVDLCAPVGTPVHAFADGEIFLLANYPAKFDYGNVVRRIV